MLIRIVAALVFALVLSAGHRAEAARTPEEILKQDYHFTQEQIDQLKNGPRKLRMPIERRFAPRTAAGCPLPFILQNGTIPDATQVMADFYALQACVGSGGGGGGAPINLGLTVPPELIVTGSPYTGGSGVFAIGKAAENVSTVWAGPAAGSPQPPTFRQLACADLAGGCGTPAAQFSCATTPGSCPLSIPMFWAGVPPANQVVRISLADAVTCPAGLSLSEGSAKTAATGTPVVGIYQSVGGTGAPSLVATATFTGAVPAFAAASVINFAVGDVIQYQFPNSPDATLADVSLTLHCNRTTGFTVGSTGAPIPDANIWVGNSMGIAAPVVPSGDLSMTDTGAFSVKQFNTNQTASGSTPPGPFVFDSITATDSQSVGTGFKEALGITHVFGGGATGGTQSLTVTNVLTSPTSPSNTNRNYVSGFFAEYADSSDNGTGGTPAGAFFGVGVSAVACGGSIVVGTCPVANAATNLLELTGGEVNIAALTGSSMKFKGGWTIASFPTDAVQGTTWDCELCLSNQTGAIGWKDGILFGNMNGQYPSSGTLIGSTGGSYVNGIDFSLDTISGCALKTPHDCIENGSGGSTINNLTVSGTFTASSVALLNVADQTISGGFNVTSNNLGTISSGTTTIDCGARPLQYLTNGGAFTLAAPSNDGSCFVLSTNNASAGTITFSGFSVGANTGDTLDTTNTHKFSISIWRINGTSGYRVAAHQ